MRELIALHEKILALPKELRLLCSFGWMGDSSTWWEAGVDEQDFEGWPEDVKAEFHTLTNATIAVMAEGFIFKASMGYDDEDTKGPRFQLFDRGLGRASDSANGDFVPDRSLIEQLRELSWEEQRVRANEHKRNMEAVVELVDRLTKPTLPYNAPHWSLGEDLRRFFWGIRDDVGRIHVLYWEKGHGQIKASFDTVNDLREMLPGTVARGVDIISVVAWDKSLGVECFEAMRLWERRFLREKVAPWMVEARRKKAEEAEANANVGKEPNRSSSAAKPSGGDDHQ